MQAVLLYLVFLFMACCVMGLAVFALARFLNGLLERPQKKKTPQQPDGHPPLICPGHGLEHLCKADPVDTAELESLEKYLADTDGPWLAKMNRRLNP